MLYRIWTELLHPIFFNRKIVLGTMLPTALIHSGTKHLQNTTTTLGLTVLIKVLPFTLVFSRTTPALLLPMMEKLDTVAEQALNFLSLKNLWFHMTTFPVNNQRKVAALTMLTIPTLMTRRTRIPSRSFARSYTQKPESANLKCQFPSPTKWHIHILKESSS